VGTVQLKVTIAETTLSILSQERAIFLHQYVMCTL